LITDGLETEGGDVRKAANIFKAHPITPILATVGIGDDANEELLIDIASPCSERQRRHLEWKHVLKHLPNKEKLYLRGHEKGILTEDKAEALRQFVYVLSTTKKKDEKNKNGE